MERTAAAAVAAAAGARRLEYPSGVLNTKSPPRRLFIKIIAPLAVICSIRIFHIDLLIEQAPEHGQRHVEAEHVQRFYGVVYDAARE